MTSMAWTAVVREAHQSMVDGRSLISDAAIGHYPNSDDFITTQSSSRMFSHVLAASQSCQIRRSEDLD